MQNVFADHSQLFHWLLKDKYHWRSQDAAAFTEKDISQQSVDVQHDFDLIVSGEPLQYVIGWVTFLGCHIDLSLKPLIPRPETEYWVEKVLNEMNTQDALSVLDLCCGSGCIGIAVARALPTAHIDFVDITDNALQQTQINLNHNDVSVSRMAVIKSDLFSSLTSHTYDWIFANPPYVDPTGEWPAELKHEPPEALFAQKNGLALIEKILLNAEKYLKTEGKMILEFGKGQEKEIEKMAKKGSWKKITFGQDHYEVTRYVILER